MLIIHRLNQPGQPAPAGGEGETSQFAHSGRLLPALPIHPGLILRETTHGDSDDDWFETLVRDVAHVADRASPEPFVPGEVSGHGGR